jgi:hypothetical protein
MLQRITPLRPGSGELLVVITITITIATSIHLLAVCLACRVTPLPRGILTPLRSTAYLDSPFFIFHFTATDSTKSITNHNSFGDITHLGPKPGFD